ncbi:MAG: glycosyltransferase [Patescibacteria group bacterium]|nr:glycosyltransferase [Patescibacteria group bacterium]
MKPKFTLITHDYLPAQGGISRYLSSLVRSAKGQIDVWIPLDYSYNVQYQDEMVEQEIVGNPDEKHEVRQVRFWWSMWPRWFPLIKRCLEVPKDNKILISHVFPIGTAAWLAKKIGAPEYVIIFHGTDIKRAQTKWKRWLLRRICKNASLLVVNSVATQNILKRLVPTAHSVVLTPAFEPFDLPDKIKTRAKLNINPDTKIILTVCRLVERKGVDTLIQAVANIKESNHNVKLVVIGNGPYGSTLQGLARLSGINVRWITNANDQTVHYWYTASDIFCLPGREIANDIEGFGIVYLEAAYAGLPVIAGDNGGTSEAIVNNQTGLLIEPNVGGCTDALLKLLNDPILSARLGSAGQERVIEDFNWLDRWRRLSAQIENPESGESSTTKQTLTENDTYNISVIIPAYNHANELKKTLESLWKQTIGVKEVIVVDDASQDDIESVIDIFKYKLPIRLISHEQNKGAAAARNTGLKSADGEFTIFLDADIVLEPEALAKMHQALEDNPNASYAFGDFCWGRIHFKGKPFCIESLQKVNYIHTSALIRRKDALEFDETLKKFQDWDLWLTMANQGKVGVWVPEILFKVIERKNGISRWMPSFIHKIPWPLLGYAPNEIIRYREAESIIKQKHNLNG